MQSILWQGVKEAEGIQTYREESKSWNGLFLAHTLPLVGKYWYAPRGPLLTNVSSLEKDLTTLKEEAKKNNVGWIRVEPKNDKERELYETYLQKRFRKALRDVQPRETFCIDITPTEEDLLAGMKSKTRYNVRLSERKGVTLGESNSIKSVEWFYELISTTAKRAGITSHPIEHYRALFQALPKENRILYSAQYKGKIIAMAFVVFYEDTAIYLHGGSSNEYREVMAPFFIQWQAIRDAKRRGCRWYDFGGVDTIGEKSSWQGITRFKQGFSPQTTPIRYLGTFDIVVRPIRYELYRFLQKIKNNNHV